MPGRAYIGTSGFTYAHWRGEFYPKGVPQRQWLEYYAEHFDIVEINSSYYHMPREDVCESWRNRSPAGFTFVMKLNGLITHRKRLVGCRDLLESFLQAVGRLGDRLGPILVQLPPRFQADPQRLDRFLKTCPKRFRWAVELRDESWLCEEVFDVLRSRDAALVVHDLIPRHPDLATTGWTYYRFHGPGVRYGGCYTEPMLREAAARLAERLRAGHDTYAFFNNDAHGHAVRNAMELRRHVSGACRGAVAKRE